MAFSAQVTVLDPIGLHARPAGQVAKLVKESGLEVRIGTSAEELVSAGSALRLMAMKATTGSTLTVVVETDDDAAGAAIVEQIQDFLKG